MESERGEDKIVGTDGLFEPSAEYRGDNNARSPSLLTIAIDIPVFGLSAYSRGAMQEPFLNAYEIPGYTRRKISTSGSRSSLRKEQAFHCQIATLRPAQQEGIPTLWNVVGRFG